MILAEYRKIFPFFLSDPPSISPICENIINKICYKLHIYIYDLSCKIYLRLAPWCIMIIIKTSSDIFRRSISKWIFDGIY